MRSLKNRQVEARVIVLREASRQMKGVESWIGYFRNAFGMSLKQFAAKLGVSYTAAQSLEKGEKEGGITLRSLRRAAEAMNCELVYAFVPRESVDKICTDQARRKARKIIDDTNLHMELEDQGVSKEEVKTQFDELVQKIKESKKLWDE